MKPCQRCVVGNASGPGDFCGSCNETLNRIIIRLTHADWTNAEIGDEVGLSEKAVAQRKTRLRRATRALGRAIREGRVEG